MNWGLLLSVGIGGFIGAILRFSISGWIGKALGTSFPFGTLGVNILGSFVIGFLFLYFQNINLSPSTKALFITGLLGALTTFSTFSLDTLLLMENSLWLKALSNIGLNIVLCLSATFLGMMLFNKVY